MIEPDPSAHTSLTCARLGLLIQAPLRRRLPQIAALTGLFLLLLFLLEAPHIDALLMILLGAFAPLVPWVRQREPGLPLIALLSLQTALIFATPILMRNPSLDSHPDGEIFTAAREILAYGAALAAGWALISSRPSPRRPPSECWTLKFIRADRPETLRRGALLLLTASAAYQAGLAAGALDPVLTLLPNGGYSLIRTTFDAALVAGSLIGGFAIGTRAMSARAQAAYWLLICVHFFLISASILLSANAGMIAAAALGLFLGARRPPWTFLLLSLSLLSLLNFGKFEMRSKYWNKDEQPPRIVLADYPAYYAEWIGHSIDLVGAADDDRDGRSRKGQRITDRLDNLQNLLFVQSAVEHRNVPLLHGATYSIIPPLLIPRVFWPEKPRTHEGQVMLNVHFGRQTLEDSFTTYIAWGLLAEAYANFGPILGAIICGLVLGVMAGFLERWIKPYPITSLQAFLFLILSVNLLLSFEMVASVWVTSVFQTLVALVLGIAPLAEKRRIDSVVSA